MFKKKVKEYVINCIRRNKRSKKVLYRISS